GAQIAQAVVDDQITGGDDVVDGTAFDDFFEGGAGDDVYQASGGDDTYSFAPGDGRDLIRERFAGGGEEDTLEIVDFELADLTLRTGALNDDHLVLDFGEDEVTLEYGFGVLNFGVDIIDFIDAGVTFSRQDLIELFVDQQIAANAERIIGGDFDDALVASAQTLLMEGRGGDDVYTLSQSVNANLHIHETGGEDVVDLGVEQTNVAFRIDPLNNANLIIDYALTNASVTVEGAFGLSATRRIETFVVSDFGGSELTSDQVKTLAIGGANTDGDDLILGTPLDDVLSNTSGADTLRGGDGADVYRYREGDVVIDEQGTFDEDVLELSGVAESDLIFTREFRPAAQGGDDLVIRFASDEGSIRILGSLTDDDNSRLERIDLVSEAESITIDEIRTRILQEETDAGRRLGLPNVDDVMRAGIGVTHLDGLSGNDTYVFGAGSGVLIVNDSALSTNPAVTQSLRVEGLLSTDATLERLSADSEHFQITFAGSTDRIVILGARISGQVALGVEEIVFAADGVTLSETDITARLNGFGPARRGPEPPVAEGAAEEEPAGPIEGTDAAEAMAGGTGPDLIRAGGGDDVALGGNGDDTIRGQAGDDTLMGENGADVLIGGAGDDDLYGGQGRDALTGGGGADELLGGQGRDTLKGGAGDDTLSGGQGRDVVLGGGGDDLMEGGGGRDRMIGRRGDDEMSGGKGADLLRGSAGNDTLKGGAGADELRGGADDDMLRGGGGADALFGGIGDDTLMGGGGRDRLVGGEGADVFVFRDGFAPIGEEDEIADFALGADLIDVSAIAGVAAFADLSLVGDGADTLIFAPTVFGAAEGPAIRVVGVASTAFGETDFVF
ncbi:MAG: hypothetical protein AAGF90_11270, partial [Pseudomonadota bacterium]